VTDFVAGQRWINDAELSMGLGTVLAVEHRTVSIIFHAIGETRTYAKDSAPLTRIRFNSGDQVTDIHKRKLTIDEAREQQGLLSYQVINEAGEHEWLEEQDLDTSIRLNKPLDRLLSGQVDDNRWFSLRHQGWQSLLKNFASGITGLTGARTNLIPHQLYIANEVARRYAPRVLLADEVGLGKTIEAGMILHQQLSTGRASRVLIIVPEPLINQWLVELLRRFNLFFNIYDEERCEAITQSSDFNNPFLAEQQILCSLDLFSGNAERFSQVIEAPWDLLIIDEAHHLQWSPQQASEEYQLVEQLAARSKGLLLLTATPEQFGKQSHFARLRLLDADRFNDYDSFIQQESHYQQIADLVEQINANQVLSQPQLDLLKNYHNNLDEAALLEGNLNQQARSQLINHLLDCHGTGRVLFRNTRAAIQGFPQRQLTDYPLELPAEYTTALQSQTDITRHLYPERLVEQDWTRFDPRIDWLVSMLDRNPQDKLLLICHSAATATELSRALKEKYAIASSVFHEQLSIVERDKRAADFADMESGVQLLICSEIGSEGRNFQFARHLLLFDLPLNPDLLEQRIGRLDRIGQQHRIQIHVPFFKHTAQSRLYTWYHQALNAFNSTCPAGAQIYAEQYANLPGMLNCASTADSAFNEFVAQCRQQHHDLNHAMHEGRDRLLEYSSCRKDIALDLQKRIEQFEKQSQLKPFMLDLFDSYGVNVEEHKPGSFIITPAEHMLGQFPGLYEDGMTVTFEREVALLHDDMHFLSWDHPMVLNSMDMLLGNELGNTSVCSIQHPELKAGQLLLQAVYILQLDPPLELQQALSQQLLQPLPVLITLNEQAEEIEHSLHERQVKTLDKRICKQVIQLKQTEIKDLLNHASSMLKQHAEDYLTMHYQGQQLMLENEIDRLQQLQQINPQVRDDEIAFFSDQLQVLNSSLHYPVSRLDSIRLMITT
jgi:ATP-dependent helicase HepA